jgi:hypothetical protein
MGIFSSQPKSSPYVPPLKAKSTLLGESEAATSDDLNRTPATTAELRFRHVPLPPGAPSWAQMKTSRDHAFIVITDNTTGKQWVNEAEPDTLFGDPVLGRIKAGTVTYDKGYSNYDLPYRTVAQVTTDAPALEAKERLDSFADRFTQNKVDYQLPPDVLPMIPPSMQDVIPKRNSNYCGGYAWQYLTGSVPKLPAGFDAPGWGDHTRDPFGAMP